VQLGNACLALAAAASLSSQPAEAEAALRTAVKQLRWVLGVGQEDLRRLSAAGEHPEVRVGRKGDSGMGPRWQHNHIVRAPFQAMASLP